MKKMFYGVASALFIASSAYAISIDSGDNELAAHIVGDWQCESRVSTNVFEIIHQSSETYLADGTGFSHDLTTIKFLSDALPQFAGKSLQLDMSASAQWKIKNRQISFSNTSITVNNISDPELADQLGLDNLTEVNENENTELIEITEHTMKLRLDSELGNVFAVCQRKVDVI